MKKEKQITIRLSKEEYQMLEKCIEIKTEYCKKIGIQPEYTPSSCIREIIRSEYFRLTINF